MMISHLSLSRKYTCAHSYPWSLQCAYDKTEVCAGHVIQTHNLKRSPLVLLCFHSFGKYFTYNCHFDSWIHGHLIQICECFEHIKKILPETLFEDGFSQDIGSKMVLKVLFSLKSVELLIHKQAVPSNTLCNCDSYICPNQECVCFKEGEEQLMRQ